MVSDRIKFLREAQGLTQSDLAKRIGISRSGVNAWEMGISVPSTQYIVELANIFKVSADYILGVDSSATISIQGLNEDDIMLVQNTIAHLRKKNLTIQEK